MSAFPNADDPGAVTAAREVVETGSARKVDGILLDLTTANAICAVAGALSRENRRRFNGMSIDRAAAIAWKLVK